MYPYPHSVLLLINVVVAEIERLCRLSAEDAAKQVNENTVLGLGLYPYAGRLQFLLPLKGTELSDEPNTR